jgi:hypothetical protein
VFENEVDVFENEVLFIDEAQALMPSTIYNSGGDMEKDHRKLRFLRNLGRALLHHMRVVMAGTTALRLQTST